jgi:hypothetical protein
MKSKKTNFIHSLTHSLYETMPRRSASQHQNNQNPEDESDDTIPGCDET